MCCSCSHYTFKVFENFDVCILLELRKEITVISNRFFHNPSNRLYLLQKKIFIRHLFSEYFSGFSHKAQVIFAEQTCYFPLNIVRKRKSEVGSLRE